MSNNQKNSLIYMECSMSNPILSIITICYNEKQIERTCKSIVNQTWQDFEWIVVDGGSTDGTLDILNKYKDRINILISEPDTGIYNAMNKGIKLASGTYLNFMNGGDAFYEENTLENVFKNTTYTDDVLYGNYCCFFNNIKRPNVLPTKIAPEQWLYRTLNHQSTFIKKELFNKNGLYNENFKIAADCEKFIIFYQNGASFKYIPYTISLFDMEGISTFNAKKLAQERRQIEKELLFKKTEYKCTLFGFLKFTKKRINPPANTIE